MTASSRSRTPTGRYKRLLRAVFVAIVAPLAAYYGFCALLLVSYTVLNPPTTGVQVQRRVEAWFTEGDYQKRYDPVAAEAQAVVLRHAVVAAEDSRFHQHGGIDWEAVQDAIADNRERGEPYRGGSTITQQLVKNLFMTTHSSYVRKALELPLTYLAERILSKERILTLYLNVIEWDDGVYGAEAAARHYYGTSAGTLSRYQAASLAAVIPNPRERSPDGMGWYANIILRRMRQMGW